MSVAEHKWATKLMNPPAAWPTEVAENVDAMSKATLRIAKFRGKQEYASSAHGWLVWNGKANDVDDELVGKDSRESTSSTPARAAEC